MLVACQYFLCSSNASTGHLQLTWLNVQLEKIWPYVNEVIFVLIPTLMLCLNLGCGDRKEEKKREIGKENELITAKLLFPLCFLV